MRTYVVIIDVKEDIIVTNIPIIQLTKREVVNKHQCHLDKNDIVYISQLPLSVIGWKIIII